jgi:hypothetical protein
MYRFIGIECYGGGLLTTAATFFDEKGPAELSCVALKTHVPCVQYTIHSPIVVRSRSGLVLKHL